MQFAVSYPWWVLVLLAAATLVVAWASYAGTIAPLGPRRRAALVALRALALLFLVACLLRPVRSVPPEAATDAVVPVLVDISRSMQLRDTGGAARIDVARDVLEQHVQPALARRFRPEVWTFGETLAPMTGAEMSAGAGRSDLSGALRALRERYRERPVAGIVVISDGGETGEEDAAALADAVPAPVYTIGVGSTRLGADFEVLDVSAGELALADSSVDMTVAAVHHGSSGPFDLRVLENGRPVDLRRVTPAADGSPVRALFTVSPPRETATLYTVEIPSAAGELVVENNRRSVLVEPAGRQRRVLMIEGAPGFEHSFIKRALAADQGIELDSVVRKGSDARGAPTYFVQASEQRAHRLTTGFPHERTSLYEYDALVLANVEADALSRSQLQMIADFVDRRGGGVLLFGAKSFLQQSFAGTPFEEVLPLKLTGRGDGVVPVSARAETRLAVTLTADGSLHPVMRIDGGAEDLAKRWAAVPALAGVAALGALRPGAMALALVHATDGPRPLVAVQRFGQGRSMVFTGEASWRWRMQLPSADRTHELFWRQAVRWISAAAPDPVSVGPMRPLLPGSAATIAVDVRNTDFAPVGNADVHVRVTAPGGEERDVSAALADPLTGRYSIDMRFEDSGIYRVTATAARSGAAIGRGERWILVGGADLELADPRLNDKVLRRLAVSSGGGYVPAGEAGNLSSLLDAAATESVAPRLEELWHTPWIFMALILLLGAEWTLRRRWGLR